MSPAASACLFPYAPQPLPLLTLSLFSSLHFTYISPPATFFLPKGKDSPTVSRLSVNPHSRLSTCRWKVRHCAFPIYASHDPLLPVAVRETTSPEKRERTKFRAHSFWQIQQHWLILWSGLSVFHSIRMDLNHLELNLLVVVHPSPPSAGRNTEWAFHAAVSWNN